MVLTDSEALRAQALARRRESILANEPAEIPLESLTTKERRREFSVFDRHFHHATE
jgi:hypothetical protein